MIWTPNEVSEAKNVANPGALRVTLEPSNFGNRQAYEQF